MAPCTAVLNVTLEPQVEEIDFTPPLGWFLSRRSLQPKYAPESNWMEFKISEEPFLEPGRVFFSFFSFSSVLTA